LPSGGKKSFLLAKTIFAGTAFLWKTLLFPPQWPKRANPAYVAFESARGLNTARFWQRG